MIEKCIVSVIITTHNRVNWLKEALDSVAMQTYNDYEVLIINDHKETSKDVEAIASKYQKTHLINNFETPGANFSRNMGINTAIGDYIAFLDDDDIWDEEYLQIQINNLEVNDIDLTYCGYYEFWDRKKPIILPIKSHKPPSNVQAAMAKGQFCPDTTSTVIVKSNAIREHGGFDTELNSFQDWDMWYRLSGTCRFGNIEPPLVKFRQHLGARTSVDYSRRLKGLKQVIKKHKGDLDKNFYKKFKLGCYYANAKKLAMFNHKKDCFAVLLSTHVFYTSFQGIRLMLEVLYKCFLCKN